MPSPTTPDKEPMSSVDATWLHLEEPNNLMMISGVMGFSHPVTLEALRETLEARLTGPYRRFRQRVVEPRLGVGSPVWEEVPDFCIDDHLEVVDVPEPCERKDYQTVVSHYVSEPLPRERPLWSIHLLRERGEFKAVFVRIHHCIADGIALVVVLLSMTDPVTALVESDPMTQEIPQDTVGPQEATASSTAGVEASSLFERLRGLSQKALQTAEHGVIQSAWEAGEQLLRDISRRTEDTTHRIRELSQRLLEGGQSLLRHPERIVEQVQIGAQGLFTPIRMLLEGEEPQTRFRGALGIQKKVAWSPPFPLDAIKALKTSTQGTINDILIAAMTGAVRRYLDHHQQALDGLELRAAIPVNLRSIEAARQLGNSFGLVFLQLPVGEPDRMTRVRLLKQRMDTLKRSPEALVSLGILRAFGWTTAEITRWLGVLFGRHITCVMTNVPGPKEPLTLAGQPIDTLMFWVPQTGHVGLGVSILSYAGHVRLGVAVDAGLVDDPEALLDAFALELDAMRQEAGLPPMEEAT